MNRHSTEFRRQLRLRLVEAPLWDFALALYGRPGVESACLTLQDEGGHDVCELLWRCWLYRHGAETGPCPDEVLRWQCEVTAPLRHLRRALKAEANAHPGVASVRSHLQQAELAAEHETLERLMKISLESEAITPLPRPRPGLEKVLLPNGESQKKSQVMAIISLESQLDPPQAAR
ncbi:TIGR02444 family protein [Halomonas sp. V046]|uniref:TIGR02444 family protein n=1 Tax=Halomonas sp. V046 TaxID=3459611 RepID=UPI004044E8D8